jgi:hypothetical protein
MVSLQDVTDFLRAKKDGQHAMAETLLLRLIDATEDQARTEGHGVAPWYYEELAILLRKQKRSDDEIAILQRFARAPKAPGVGPFRLAIRLEEALLVKEEGRYGPKLKALRAMRARAQHVTIETDLGTVTMKNPYQGTVAIIASGQSEEYIRWYYDLHRKEELIGVVAELNQYLQGEKPRSSWNDSYFTFMQKAPSLLAELPTKRNARIQENRSRILRKEPRVIWGPYKSTPEHAQQAAKSLGFGAGMSSAQIHNWFKSQPSEVDEDSTESLLIQPTLNAGWSNVRVVALPRPR